MSLPLQAIDELFRRLSVAYGHRFMSLWDGIPVDDVKADWANVLSGLTPAHLDFGMGNLPGGRPMDAREFRALCMRMPEKARQFALPDMRPPKVPEAVREQLARLSQPNESTEPERVRWARKFIENFGSEGQVLNSVQRTFLKEARRIVERHQTSLSFDAAKAETQAKVDAMLARQGESA